MGDGNEVIDISSDSDDGDAYLPILSFFRSITPANKFGLNTSRTSTNWDKQDLSKRAPFNYYNRCLLILINFSFSFQWLQKLYELVYVNSKKTGQYGPRTFSGFDKYCWYGNDVTLTKSMHLQIAHVAAVNLPLSREPLWPMRKWYVKWLCCFM